jgi:gliding motility-associated transport system permease protein/gliding motility-associatede transport system auxiliary component
MQPNTSQTATFKRIAAKETTLFFASPIAYLFLATFAAVTLFVFFWGEAFFSRNIADVRPLFEWMPVLLIFLSSTLTMRLWSEERRTGTLEHVLTQPVALWQFVIGKFWACLILLLMALAITLPLPITVALMGELDWGPVWAGYLATFLLGAAYLSIGLFVSARSDNQIVSLISSVAVCGLFYLVGTTAITDFFGNQVGEWLRLLGTGARFDAITRGVIDLRDLYYYLSMVAVFLALNTYVLERERWASFQKTPHHKVWRSVTALLLANAVIGNIWLSQINTLRIDVTQGNQYSISAATETYLGQLQEPLLLRGYFSAKTHPLLAPLVPQLRDLIREYEIVGNGNVRVEFVDPVSHPELESEANQSYGIQPVPFQVADRYQSSIVSSYFNVLVKYGDEYEVLGFTDLIEVKSQSESDLDVQLRNPEHDLTRAIKKVLHGYQAGGNLFDTVKNNLAFTGYVSADNVLPEKLLSYKNTVQDVIKQYSDNARGRLSVDFIDPSASGGQVAEQIAQDYGFQPMALNLFSSDRFYFYLTLAGEGQAVQIPLEDMTEASFKRNLDAGIKRFAKGFTKTVAVVSPAPVQPGYGQHGSGGTQFNQLQSFLGAELNVQNEDLSDGRVSGEADLLLLLAPKNLDEKQLFAVDQFLMQGGTVIAATSPFSASFANRRLNLQSTRSGLEPWLDHHGIHLQQQLVMDPKNAAFPVPVTRNLGGMQLQEIRMLDYPYFVDVRGQGLNEEHVVTTDLPQATLAWASPIVIDSEKHNERTITELLRSSDQSWLSASMDIMPRVTEAGLPGFTPQGERASQLLAVVSAGRFESFYSGKSSPLLAGKDDGQADDDSENTAGEQSANTENTDSADGIVSSVIERSPESARIIVFSSNDFLSDIVVSMAGSAGGGEYLNTMQLLTNTVDWSLEDAGLLSIRARSHFNRTLVPMEHNAKLFWEYLNYVLAIFALAIIAFVQFQRKQARQRRYLKLFAH